MNNCFSSVIYPSNGRTGSEGVLQYLQYSRLQIMAFVSVHAESKLTSV